MTERVLKPPARFTHALLVALVLAVAGLLSGTIGQRPTLVVALVTLGLFLAGFWSFSRDAWVYTAVGTVGVTLGGLGVLVTGAWAFLAALGAPSGGSFLLSLGVTLAVIGTTVAVIGGLVPTAVTRQDGPALVGLLYAGGLAVGIVVTITAVQLGVASLFGTSLSSLVGTIVEELVAVMTANPVARAGSLALLAGASLWYATRLAGLPLGRRFSRGLALRWNALQAEDGVPGGTGDSQDTGSGMEAGPGTPGSEPPTVSRVVGLGPRGAAVPRWVGAATFYLGLATLVLALAPEMQRFATEHPVAVELGAVLGGSATTQRSLIGLLAVLGGLRIAHALVWRGLNVDWTAYGRRLGHGTGAVVVVLGAGVTGRPVVALLLETPALQFVPMGDSGPLIVATDSGLGLAASGLAGFGFEQRPELFETWFRGIVELLSPATVGIAFLAVAVGLSILVLITATIAAAGAGLTRPGAGIGLLFVASAGVAVIGASEVLAFAAGAGALLAWELHTYGGSLNRQLDPRASTLTAEFVHLGAAVVVVGLAVVVTLAGLRAVAMVPTPATQWQVLGALGLSLTALVTGLLYLGLWGDRAAATTGAS